MKPIKHPHLCKSALLLILCAALLSSCAPSKPSVEPSAGQYETETPTSGETQSAATDISGTNIPAEFAAHTVWENRQVQYLPTDPVDAKAFRDDGKIYVDYAVNYSSGGTIKNGVEQIELGVGEYSVEAVPNLGYKFVMWSDGVTSAARTDSADTISESTVLTAIFDYDILEMPIIAIDTETGEDVTSKTDYINADFSIMGTEQKYEISSNVQIRGRGNSTWGFEKKSYKFKFPEKVNLFDLGTGKGDPY